MTESPITCTVDLSAPGRNIGFLHVPHSVHRSAYGQIPVPIASVVGNAPGPSVLLMAGNHGDEYEGQVILSELIRMLDPADMSGRILLLPMANFPAAEAGLRVSPLDDGNLNRSFPGVALGKPTEMIAYYIEHVLMQGIDVAVDLHSGGSSLYCIPFVMTAQQEDDPQAERRKAVIDGLALPAVLYYAPSKLGWFSSSAAIRAGAIAFTVELGGGGTVDASIRASAQNGILRALAALGMYAGSTHGPVLAEQSQAFYAEETILAPERGVFESLVMAGDFYEEGQLLGHLHRPEDPGHPPHDVVAARDGVVLAQRVPARTLRGDALFHVGYPD